MAFVQATVWLACCSALGYILLKLTTPNEEKYMKNLQERGLIGPQGPSGPLGFAPRSAEPQDSTAPIVPATANPFYRSLRTASATTGVSKEDTDSRKTAK